MDQEVFDSASKIRTQAAFGEIIILIVYIPILTLVGVEGKMFSPMAKTVGFAIFGALILSLTYIPMMCALFLPRKGHDKKTFSDKFIEKLHQLYAPLLDKAIRVKYIIVSIAVAIFLFTIFVFNRMGGEFIPQLQEGDYAFHCILPPGTSLSQSIETSMQASRIIKEFEEVKMVVGKTGAAEVPTDPMPPEATDIMVILNPQNEWKSGRTYEELGNAIMEKLQVIPGVFFEKNQPIQMRFNELMTGIRQDVAVKIFGENLDTLLNYANTVNAIIQTVPGTTAPQVEQVTGLPQINIQYDRVRMANYGLTVEDVNDVVSTAFAGKSSGMVYENERRFDLVVRLHDEHRNNIEDVSQLLIPTQNHQQIPLSQVAKIDFTVGPAQISREEGKRRIVIGFNVAGRDVQSVVEEIQDKLGTQVKLPSGYYFTYGGQFENLQQASSRLMIAVPISLFLIFLLLYFTFHSFKQATLIFTAIPMSAIGGVFALLIRDMPFSISAGVGFIALFGVAVLNGIVLIGKFNQLEKEGMTDIIQRVKVGTEIRLRPVLMTATVASLGFLPMAISTSAGAEVQKPLATVVIGGLVTATILTLFVLPLLYIIFNSKIKVKPTDMKTTISIFILGFLGLSTANAQQKVNMDQAIQIAVENNKGLKANDLEIRAAESLLRTSGELPKTDLNFQYGQNDGFEQNDAISISQTIPFPTLFKSRKALITEQVKAKQVEKSVGINQLKQQVRTYFLQIAYLENNERKLKSLDSIYRDFIRIAEVRYNAGDTKKVDINTAQAKQGEINLLYKQNETLMKNAYNSLKNLMQVSEDFEVETDEIFEPIRLSEITDTSKIADHPQIQTLYQQARIAESSKQVEKSSGLPDFNIGYTNASLMGMHERNGIEKYYGRGQRFNSFDVGIAIPLTYGTTKAKIRSLDFEKQAAEMAAEWEKQKLQNEYSNLMNQYEQNLAQFNYFKDNALPNAREIINAAKLGYSAGDISYVEYLFALQTTTDIYLNYLKSIQSVNESVISIYSIINQ